MPPKRKKRFHGLYYHSSPPRVLPMNGQGSSETKKKSADDFSVRLSTIRIWMHEKDIGKLTRVLWAGQGNRLRQQASTNPRVKRFLAAVPYVMNTIKDVHQSVVDNSLETLQATMEPPVPPSLITSKDLNGLNVIHKAAGLGHTMVLEYLLGIWPDGAHETDMTGKTPLHWAASAKNNMRCYTLLTQAGCEEDALDYKMKTPAYYKQKHNEIERSFLTLVPEAPRVSQDIPTDWDTLASDDSDERKKPEIPNGRRKSDIIGNGMNLLTSRSEANSIENTSEPDLFEGDKSTEDASEAQPPEPVVNGKEEENPPEDSHLEDEHGVGEHSEPPSPPKTPGEKTEENLDGDEENGRVIYEPAPPPTPPLQEEENDSIALSDHNNDDTNENKEDAEDGDEKNNDANGDSNEIDKSEGEGGNVDEGEDGEDQKDGGVSAGDDDVDTKRDLGDKEEENDENLEEDEVQGEEEKENERENDERDSTSKIDDNIEREKMEEQDDVENDDETHSVNDNEDKSEETGENINESEVKDEEATEEENDHTSETEQENETESTPLEDAEQVEEDTGNTENLERPKTQDGSYPVEADTENLERPNTQDGSYLVEADTENAENLERPKTQDEFASKQNEVSPQTPATESPSDERKAKSVEPKLNKPQEPQKETDDDDDAQVQFGSL